MMATTKSLIRFAQLSFHSQLTTLIVPHTHINYHSDATKVLNNPCGV